jgi:hypothetical protein
MSDWEKAIEAAARVANRYLERDYVLVQTIITAILDLHRSHEKAGNGEETVRRELASRIK